MEDNRDCMCGLDGNKVKDAILQTWDAIAGDVADIGPVTVEIAVEMTVDADRMEMYARDKDVVAAFRKCDSDNQFAFATKIFERYGLTG